MKNLICLISFAFLCHVTTHAQDSTTTSRAARIQKARERIHRYRMAAEEKKARATAQAEQLESAPRLTNYYREDSATRALLARRLTVRVTPTSLIDLNGPCLPVGLEYRIYKSLAISLEGSIPMSYNIYVPVFKNNTGKTIHSDIRLRLELRKYFVMRHSRRAFVGVEAYMRQQEFTQADGFYDGPRLFHVYTYSSADIKKFHAGIAPFIGKSFLVNGHLQLDAYFGLGLRYMENNYYNFIGQKLGGKNSGWGALFVSEDQLYGHMWRPYLSVGIKIGYML